MSDYAYGRGPRRASRIAASGDNQLFRRWAACWIDILVSTAILFAGIFVGGMVIGFAGAFGAQLARNAITGIAFSVGLLAVLAYFTLAESLWGQTLGKLALGIVVVTDEGRPPGLGRSLVRTLLRLIEVNPLLLGGIPAGILVLATPKHQRLGDLIAGTYVLRKSDLREAVAGAGGADDQQARVFD